MLCKCKGSCIKQPAAQPCPLRGSAGGGLYLHRCPGCLTGPSLMWGLSLGPMTLPLLGDKGKWLLIESRDLSFFCTTDSNQDTVFPSLLCVAELGPVPLPSPIVIRKELVFENMVIASGGRAELWGARPCCGGHLCRSPAWLFSVSCQGCLSALQEG